MNVLFGDRYFTFILSSYSVTAAVLIALTVWVFVTNRARRQSLARLEASGLRRASQEAASQNSKRQQASSGQHDG